MAKPLVDDLLRQDWKRSARRTNRRVFSSPAALVEFLNNTNMEILDICSKASSGWTTTIIYTLIYRED